MKIILSLFLLTFSFHLSGQMTPTPPESLCEELAQMLVEDQKYRGSDILDSWSQPKVAYSQATIDSVQQLQIILDNKNTERLLEILEAYDWPSGENGPCPEYDTWLIFRHSQRRYAYQIIPLINQALQNGSISEWHHQLIMHHMQGRPRN